MVIVFCTAIVITIAVIIVINNSHEAKIRKMKELGKCDWCPGRAIFHVKMKLSSGMGYGICCRDCYEVSIGRTIMTDEEVEIYKVINT